MKKYSVFLYMIIVVFGFTGISYAVPILNEYDTGLYYDTFTSGPNTGQSYGFYTNSGDLLFVEDGNNTGNIDNLENAESLIENALGYSDSFELIETPLDFTSYDGNTGTWSSTSYSYLISFYAVKAGNAYAMYHVDPAENTGSWSTYDLWVYGEGGNDGVDISHFTGYNPSAPVPEPATMLLLGSGLVGLGAFGRKKYKR